MPEETNAPDITPAPRNRALTEMDEIKAELKGTEKTEKRKQLFLKALELCLGVVTRSCRATGIPRSTFYNWCETDEAFKGQVEEIGEIALDFAEDSLFNQIREQNTSATIFYLKTKGRKRGYIETVNLRHGIDREGNAEKDEILSNLTPEQRSKIFDITPQALESGDKDGND